MISGLVIAGNYRQYKNWLFEKKQSNLDYKYISKIEDITGFHNLPILLIGTWWETFDEIDILSIGQYIQD